MAQSQSSKRDSGKGRPSSNSKAGWTALTWDDLDRWAGSRSVARGRTYQRGGRVKDLSISSDGALATVVGGERYATTVTLTPGRKRPSLESVCTCPVGAQRLQTRRGRRGRVSPGPRRRPRHPGRR